jgi:DNA-binding beta-propeller fold protein YncE
MQALPGKYGDNLKKGRGSPDARLEDLMMRLLTTTVIALMIAGCAAKQARKASAATFQAETILLPGEGRGDYLFVDDANSRLYVTHTNVIHILDLASLKSVGTVVGFKKAHGVAIANGKGFASDGNGNRIIVFDPATGKTTKIIPAGQNPDSILFDAPSGMIFVFNGISKDISVLDPVKEAIVKTIPIGDKPEFSRSDGAGKVYFNMEESHAIGVIDTAKAALIAKYVLSDCEGPAALGIDTANQRLFSSCSNGQMKVVDANNGNIVASLPVGEDPDGITYDPANKRIFVAARDGEWTIIDQQGADRYIVNQVYKIDPYAKTTAFDGKTGRVFSSTADLIWPTEVQGQTHLPDAKPGTFRLMVVSQN